MTKYRNLMLAALAVACLAATAQGAWAWSFEEVYAPRAVPGLELASLDVPVAKAAASIAAEAPAAPEPLAPATMDPAARKTPWQRFLDFLGF